MPHTDPSNSRRLLCLSYRFPPETYPLAIRVKYFLTHLREQGWDIDAITAAPDAASDDGLTVHQVRDWTPTRLIDGLRTLRLGKLLDLTLWPDEFVLWNVPAYLKARALLRTNEYDAIAVFMMPYSQGLTGLLLKQETGLPLILNLNDSPTCSDMNPSHPTYLHDRMARKLEDQYVQAADAAIYVSRRNMERVRDRQPPQHRDKFRLIRRGAQPLPSPDPPPTGAPFRIVYTGGTSGWYRFLQNDTPSLPKRLYHAWKRLGTYSTTTLDYRTHGPIYVGQAVKQVIETHPEWTGRIQIDVYGEAYPDSVVDPVLDRFGLHDIVNVHGRVPHEDALRKMTNADLLFMALPDRVDGSPGGRISAKTYEYLMTDRPILAALPPGENREYLQDKPGVSLTAPDGVDEMADVITNYASTSFAGIPTTIDRSGLQPSLSSTTRAEAFEGVVREVLARPHAVNEPAPALAG